MKAKGKPADWWPRFLAWLIDVIIIGVVSSLLLLPFSLGFSQIGVNGIIIFIYWTLLDSEGRQSIGKKVINLRLIHVKGRNATIIEAAISSFGKAFLLPLDFIIGVLARPGKKQRLFNIISDTIVVRK